MTLYKSAKDALAAIQNTGRNRGLETIDQILILSFMAGMYVAFGAYLALLTGGNVPEIRQNNPGVAKLLFGVTFTVGLMFIILTGSDLFTGNSFSIPTSVYSKKTRIWTIINAIKNIVLTFIGNFLGALFVGFFFVYLLNDGKDAWTGYLKEIAEKKVHKPVWQLFISSIGCNIIVASAVFIVYTAEDVAGKLLATFFPITAFAVYGFEHVVANMFFLPTAAMFGANFQIWEMLVYNILPVTVGNYLGGAVFVGFVFWYAHIWRNKHKDGLKHILIHILRKMNVHVEDHTSDDAEHHDTHQELQTHVDQHDEHHDTKDHHNDATSPNPVITVQSKV